MRYAAGFLVLLAGCEPMPMGGGDAGPVDWCGVGCEPDCETVPGTVTCRALFGGDECAGCVPLCDGDGGAVTPICHPDFPVAASCGMGPAMGVGCYRPR